MTDGLDGGMTESSLSTIGALENVVKSRHDFSRRAFGGSAIAKGWQARRLRGWSMRWGTGKEEKDRQALCSRRERKAWDGVKGTSFSILGRLICTKLETASTPFGPSSQRALGRGGAEGKAAAISHSAVDGERSPGGLREGAKGGEEGESGTFPLVPSVRWELVPEAPKHLYIVRFCTIISNTNTPSVTLKNAHKSLRSLRRLLLP